MPVTLRIHDGGPLLPQAQTEPKQSSPLPPSPSPSQHAANPRVTLSFALPLGPTSVSLLHGSPQPPCLKESETQMPRVAQERHDDEESVISFR
ncbi:hypothetical protein QQP08_026609 [Theobroma cacao]|nr:hypothetical protein QQP08_026609 [Theobroma cacao]